MTILDEIVAHKKIEVQQSRELYPVKLLEKSLYYEAKPVSLAHYLTRPDKRGIIAEIKRRSPSKGTFKKQISVEDLSIGYMQAGASALSILTDSKFFGGSPEDLSTARRFNFSPILRKDFIIDEYQVVQAKSIGADAILLIAAILSPREIKSLAAFAKSFGLEVLLEVHSAEELKRSACDDLAAIGVNNRDLRDFSVDINRSLELAPLIPSNVVKVAESGISDSATIKKLRSAGFSGFLLGEAFMSRPNPVRACAQLIAELADG